tara:strand:- start:14273 stop:14533 length:261 start_codon:yes stop_codon:yes gene_type:complete
MDHHSTLNEHFPNRQLYYLGSFGNKYPCNDTLRGLTQLHEKTGGVNSLFEAVVGNTKNKKSQRCLIKVLIKILFLIIQISRDGIIC